MNMILKTATAAIAAATAITGAAFAQDLTATGNDDLLQEIYAKVDADRAFVFEAVLAKAEAQMEIRFAKIDNNLFDDFDKANPAPVFVLASNE